MEAKILLAFLIMWLIAFAVIGIIMEKRDKRKAEKQRALRTKERALELVSERDRLVAENNYLRLQIELGGINDVRMR